MAQQPPVDQGLLIIVTSRLHLDRPHSVGLTLTSDKPDAEVCTYTPQPSQEIPQFQQASGRRPMR